MKLSQFASQPPHPPLLTRRTFLQFGLSASAALFPPFLETGLSQTRDPAVPIYKVRSLIKGESRKSLILVVMQGGPSHFDTFDPRSPHTDPFIRGPFSRIETSQKGVYVTDQLPRIAKSLKHIRLYRNIFHKYTDHWEATANLFTGSSELNVQREADRPSPFVSLPEHWYVLMHYHDRNAFEPTNPLPYAGLHIRHPQTLFVPWSKEHQFQDPFGSKDSRNFAARADLLHALEPGNHGFKAPALERFENIRERALAVVGGETRNAFNLEQEPPAVRDRYGRNPFGEALLLARRMTERGVKTAVVNYGNWDFHEDIDGEKHRAMLAVFDQGFSALTQDVRRRDLPALIAAVSEFGRTPRLNAGLTDFLKKTHPGRDHWPNSNFMLVSGKGIESGLVGKTADNGSIIGESLDAGVVAEGFFNWLGYARFNTATHQRASTFKL